MRRFKVLLFTLSLICGAFLFLAGTHYLCDGFKVAKIECELPFQARWEVDNIPDSEIVSILDQKFFYMGKGSQCYVFASEDQQYILKFFRHKRYRLPSLAYQLRLPSFLQEIQNAKLKKKTRKLRWLFTSCKLAFQEMREEAGLVYLHLNKTNSLKQLVTFHDNLKRPFALDIDRYEFIVQKRGELVYPYLTRLIREGKLEEAKEALADMMRVLLLRFEKGIANSDAVVHKNCGFLHGRALYFDIGDFYIDISIREKAVAEAEVHKITAPLRAWLTKKAPELVPYANLPNWE